MKVTLSSTPTKSLAGVNLTKVVYTIAWGSTAPRSACTAAKPGKDDSWSCVADLVKLGAPLGKVVFGFDVFDDAGDLRHSPDGARTVTFAAPPPPPTAVKLRETAGPSDGTGWPTVRLAITFREVAPAGTEVRVYALTECPTPGTPEGVECVTSKTHVPKSIMKLIARVPATKGSVSWVWPQWEDIGGADVADGDTWYYGLIVIAVNTAGQSKFVVADSGGACTGCAY